MAQLAARKEATHPATVNPAKKGRKSLQPSVIPPLSEDVAHRQLGHVNAEAAPAQMTAVAFGRQLIQLLMVALCERTSSWRALDAQLLAFASSCDDDIGSEGCGRQQPPASQPPSQPAASHPGSRQPAASQPARHTINHAGIQSASQPTTQRAGRQLPPSQASHQPASQPAQPADSTTAAQAETQYGRQPASYLAL